MNWKAIGRRVTLASGVLGIISVVFMSLFSRTHTMAFADTGKVLLVVAFVVFVVGVVLGAIAAPQSGGQQ